MPTIEQQPERSPPGNSVTPASTNTDRDGEQAPLETSDNNLVNLRYPLDLGEDPIYKHLMRINIYKQIKSKFDTGVLGANAFDDERAGASKVTDLNAAKGLGIFLGKEAVAGTAKIAGGLLPGNIGDTLVNGAGKAVAGATALAGLANRTIERKTVKQPVAYISLYLPETMTVTDRHDFDAVSVTEALGNAGVAGALVGGGGLTSGELTATAAETTGAFGSGIKDVVLASEGYSMNPQLEILYKGSKNRQFVYSFKFTPRDQKEAESVIGIIKTLRFHAAPEYGKEANASRYFIPPSEFDIEFYVGSQINKNLPRIAQCVLENIDVNFASAGQYSTFVDGMPVEITMQLTFTETIILTKEDIDSGF